MTSPTLVGILKLEAQKILFEAGKKKCPNCKQVKLLECFYLRKSRSTGRRISWATGYSSWCKDCMREIILPLSKESQLQKRYGLTMAEYRSLLVGAICQICGSDRPKGRGYWHLDHDHETGKVRGVLCSECNLGLGKFKDNPDLLRKAFEYLIGKN